MHSPLTLLQHVIAAESVDPPPGSFAAKAAAHVWDTTLFKYRLCGTLARLSARTMFSTFTAYLKYRFHEESRQLPPVLAAPP